MNAPVSYSLNSVTPAQLFGAFLTIALSGFGGTLAWSRRTLVEEKRWLSPREYTDTLSLCQFLPGPSIVNLAVTIGTRAAGARGALAAFAGLVGAPFCIVLVLGALYTGYGHLPAVAAALRGIAAVAAGLMVATALKMASARSLRSVLALFGVLTFVGVVFARLPLAFVLLGFAPFSVLVAWRRMR